MRARRLVPRVGEDSEDRRTHPVPTVPTVLTVLLVTLLESGCSLITDDGHACTANVVAGLNLTVRDSVTGIAAGRNAIVGARDGDYSEMLRFLGDVIPSDSLTFMGAQERPGTYLITVTKAGYLTWVRTGVRVVADECHVHPVTVEVRLQPIFTLNQ